MRAVVLTSGGIDSTTCLAMKVKELGKENVVSVAFEYGQKHSKELECAQEVAKYYDVRHEILDIRSMVKYSQCTLLEGRGEITKGSYSQQKVEEGETVKTYVPYRNGLMLSAATALGVSLWDEEFQIVYGAHADDSAKLGNGVVAYADCSKEFIRDIGRAIHKGTYNKAHLVAPFKGKKKWQIVKKGLQLKVPYELTWSCYEGKKKPCGACGTCIDRQAAFAKNLETDPVEYERSGDE